MAKQIPVKIIDRTSRPSKSNQPEVDDSKQLTFVDDDSFSKAVASAIVKNVGDRQYWPNWGKKVGEITHNVESRIIDLKDSHSSIKTAYDRFSDELSKTLKTKIEPQYLSAMTAQHIVTMPVFEDLFGKDRFSLKNPISQALESFIDEINKLSSLTVETESLGRFYKEISRSISQIENPDARLEILKYLYESFFKFAMPETSKQMGVVYTPNKIVDFMIRFVDSICKDGFGRQDGISEKGVNILDPFTGTGTFIYRLLTIKDFEGDYLIKDDRPRAQV